MCVFVCVFMRVCVRVLAFCCISRLKPDFDALRVDMRCFVDSHLEHQVACKDDNGRIKAKINIL